MDTTEAHLLAPEVAAQVLSLADRLNVVEAAIRRLSSDVADSLSVRVATVQCERDVVPPLSLDVLTGPFAVGDAVVADLALGGLIKGAVVGLRGADVLIDAGKHGNHSVDPGRVIHCPGEWVK